MGMRTWITSLATFGKTVSGVNNSYDLNEIPEKITRAMLPCLIPLPELEDDQGLTLDGAMGGAPHDGFTVTHQLLFVETANLKLQQVLPDLIVQRDNYIAAAINQRWLAAEVSPDNMVPIAFAVTIGYGMWADTEYHLLNFKYKVRINL